MTPAFWPLIGVLAIPWSHPLGARTFDRATQVEIASDRIRVDYHLTLSELTLTTELLKLVEEGSLPADADKAARLYQTQIAPVLAGGLAVSLDGSLRPLDLVGVDYERSDHVYLTFHFETAPPPTPPLLDHGARLVSISDSNFAGEPGYTRMAVRAANGVQLIDSSVPESLDLVPLVPTWELTPEAEEARANARASFQLATDAPSPSNRSQRAIDPDDEVATPDARTDRLRDLLGRRGGGPAFWAATLGLAFLLGMAHAVKPGHGKTMVAAYLVGTRGTVRDACVLGLITTLTHTGSVLFVALLLRPFAGSSWVEQDSVRFWLTLLSGALITLLGIGLFWRRWHGEEDIFHVHGEGGGGGGHTHLPDGSIHWHSGGPGHAHHHHGPMREASAPSLGNLASLGFSGGLVPCDDAVVLLLAAMGAGLLAQAIYLLLAFSAGLAAVLVVLGIFVVKLRGFAASGSATATPGPANLFLRWLPIVSAAIVTLVGVVVCAAAFGAPFGPL